MATSDQNQQSTIGEIHEGYENNETTPLLRGSLSELSLTIAKHDSAESYIHAAKKEIKWMASSSSLTILTLLLEFSFYTVNVLVVGHLGAKELAAMSLAVTCQVIIAMAPSFGLLSAMDTFCSTAYTASRDKTLVGFHFQRGIIAACTHFIIVAPILWNAESILLLLKQDPEIAHLSGLYLRIHILSTLPFALFEATKRYLQAQGIMRAGTIVTLIIAPIHWINSYVFVRSQKYGIGFVGAPIVNVFSNCMLLAGIALYTCNSRAMETWGGWKLSAFRNMWVYYRLAIPSVISTSVVWVCVELLTLGSSYFGANQLAGQAIIMNFANLLYQVCSGLAYSTSPRIGNLIGAAKPRQARISSNMAFMASVCIVAAGTLLLLLTNKWWISVYTSDPNVAIEAAKLIPAASILVVVDGVKTGLNATLVGLGRQRISAEILIFSFYMCGIPIGYTLGYIVRLETAGLLWGMCIANSISLVAQFVYIYVWIDWKDEVRLCLVRLKGNGNNIDDTAGDITE
ncbi:ethionine resistance protein [Coemansia sp. RSA 1813]|nr:ethionine resistance protein [Coemansia sp. RSA 986]KAJ2571795.1 ethionine resistance protein [Coemansia sp. RSA 1813]